MKKHIKKRSLSNFILLCILTFGFYYLYWLYKIQNDFNSMDNDYSVGGAKVALLYCLTFSLYGYYWFYKQGDRIQHIGHILDLNIKDSGATYIKWVLIGAFTMGIGSVIAMNKFIQNFNRLSYTYNSNLGGTV